MPVLKKNRAWLAFGGAACCFALLVLWGCEKIPNPGMRDVVTTNPADIVFALTNLQSARPEMGGKAVLKVSSKSDFKVTCTNCSAGFSLDFVDTTKNGSSDKEMTAAIEYHLVDKTYSCIVNLEITYSKFAITNHARYIIYLCPENPNTGKRQCDKQNATSQCAI